MVIGDDSQRGDAMMAGGAAQNNSSTPQKGGIAALPETARWLLAFQACNACNFTIALGAPLVLTARFLGSSETQIGILNAVAPLAVALQLLSTNIMLKVGYRRMMLMGWSARSFMLLLIVPLPLLMGTVSPGWLTWGLVLALVLYNVLRGLAAGSWLPWLTDVLPERQRGLYLGLEMRTMNLSGFVTLLACGWFLGQDPDAKTFAAIYFVAWMAGMASVWFLKKTAETPPGGQSGEKPRSLTQQLKATRMIWAYTPFRRITRFVAVQAIVASAFPAFLVLYVNEELGRAKGDVLWLQAIATLGVLLGAVRLGNLCDRIGSRPVLTVAIIGQGLVLLGWALIAGGLLPGTLSLVVLLYVMWGVMTSAQAIAGTRMVLGSSPPGQVSLAMPIYQVLVALTGGLAPIAWGMILEHLRRSEVQGVGGTSFSFLLFFSTCMFVVIVAFVLLRGITESETSRLREGG